MEEFYESLKVLKAKTGKNSSLLPDQRYDQLIKEVLVLKSSTPVKTSRVTWLRKRFDVLTENGEVKLIFPGKERRKAAVLYYVRESELYRVLSDVHTAIGHRGRDRMMRTISCKYKNVARNVVLLFLRLCKQCRKNKRGRWRNVTVDERRETTRTGTTTRTGSTGTRAGTTGTRAPDESTCRVNVLDFRRRPDGKYRFIMVYRDRGTGFVVLRPLEFRRAQLVVYHLVDVFALLGAPSVLRSDCGGREFSEKIASGLRDLWPDLRTKVVSRRVVDGDDGDDEDDEDDNDDDDDEDPRDMLTAWMRAQNTCQWSLGLRFVQLTKNCTRRVSTAHTPYEAMFGRAIAIGRTFVQGGDGTSERTSDGTSDGASDGTSDGARDGTRNGPIGGVRGETRGEKRDKVAENSAKTLETDPVPRADADEYSGCDKSAPATKVTDGQFCRFSTRNGVTKLSYKRSPPFTVDGKRTLRSDGTEGPHMVGRKYANRRRILSCACKTGCAHKNCLCIKNKVLCSSQCHINYATCSNK